jgi:hypothetical protein
MTPYGKRIFIIVRYHMMRRIMFNTDILPLLAQEADWQLHIITPDAQDAEALSGQMQWHDIDRPMPSFEERHTRGQRAGFAAHRLLSAPFKSRMDYPNLAFRFNQLSGFASHKLRQGLSPEQLEVEARAGNFLDRNLGRPLSGNWPLFRLLYGLHFDPWQYNDAYVETLFDTYPPDLVVFIHTQTPNYKPYILAAKRRGIPVLGMVGSWDQPTTKGPMMSGVGHFVVQNQQMANELIRFHFIPPEFISVTGWPQMDAYHPVEMEDAAEFRIQLGLPPEQKLLLFGANRLRLGGHEPAIMAHLLEQIKAGVYGPNVSLIVRPHPGDSDWRERLAQFEAPPWSRVLPSSIGDLPFLANLLHHSTAVLASGGSILLDAVAQDRTALGLAFAADGAGAADIYYKLDHNAAAVQTGGIMVAENFAALDEAIQQVIADPQHHHAARARLRASHLEPLDGNSSARFVELIGRSLAGEVPFQKKYSSYPWRRP